MRRPPPAGTNAPGQERGQVPWASPADALLDQLGTGPSGLNSTEAAIRLDRYVPIESATVGTVDARFTN